MDGSLQVAEEDDGFHSSEDEEHREVTRFAIQVGEECHSEEPCDLIPWCIGRGVRLGSELASESSSPGGGVWKSGTQKSGKLETQGPGKLKKYNFK